MDFKNLTTRELKIVLDELCVQGKMGEHIQELLKYENYRRLYLLDNENGLKYSTALFQAMENKEALNGNRKPAKLKFDDIEAAACLDPETNKMFLANMLFKTRSPYSAIHICTCYPHYTKHESSHGNDFALFKYVKSTNPAYAKYIEKLMGEINNNIPCLNSKVTARNTNNAEEERALQVKIMAFAIDECWRRIEFKNEDVNKHFTYYNLKELSSVYAEFSAIKETTARLKSTQDLGVRNMAFIQLKDYIQEHVIDFYADNEEKQRKLKWFFLFAKFRMSIPFTAKRAIYNRKLFEEETIKMIRAIRKEAQKAIDEINNEIEETVATVNAYKKGENYKDLRDCINFLTSKDGHDLLRYRLTETTKAIQALGNKFNLECIEYMEMHNKPQKYKDSAGKEMDDSNLKFLTNQLYDIYQNRGVVYDEIAQNQIKNSIINIFVNILCNKEAVHLLDSDIQNDIYEIVLKEAQLDKPLQEELSRKIEDLKYLKELRDGKDKTMEAEEHSVADEVLNSDCQTYNISSSREDVNRNDR